MKLSFIVIRTWLFLLENIWLSIQGRGGMFFDTRFPEANANIVSSQAWTNMSGLSNPVMGN